MGKRIRENIVFSDDNKYVKGATMTEGIVTHSRLADGSIDPLFKEYAQKIVLDYDKLKAIAEGFRAIGRKIVVTIGSWDAIHIGQVRYIIRARAAGDMLIVGYDTDRAIKKYKGEFRPLIPEEERAEMLTYLYAANFVTALDDVDEHGNWQYGLLKAIKPDTFVAVEDSYPEEQLKEIQAHVVEPVVVLQRQAENSTSSLIAKMLKGHLMPAYVEVHNRILNDVIDEIKQEIVQLLKDRLLPSYVEAHNRALKEVLDGIQERKLPVRSDPAVYPGTA